MEDSDKNTARKRVSAAPRPISPVRDRPMVLPPMTTPPPPKWEKWGHMRDVELWEAVALSVNMEPDDLPAYLGAYDRYGEDPFKICPTLFRARLQVANSNAGVVLPIKPVHPLKARCIVDLPSFGAWAASVWEDMPAELPKAAPEPQAAPESAWDAQAKPMQRSAAQDAAILAAIHKAGHDPLALPVNEPGKPGVKAAVRDSLAGNALFVGMTVFEKAWERLRKQRDIADKG